MCYYIFVTISTVGYGDFTPKTVLGRAFVGVVIIGGVAFFSVETSELLNVSNMSASGLGSYFPAKGRRHCLLSGGAVVNGSATFSEFLEEACHPARGGANAPDIVVMVPREPDPKLHQILKARWAAGRSKFLLGSLLDPRDLLRARADAADMAVILADLTAADPQSEDEETVLSAVALHRAFPKLPLRVLLIGGDSIELAVTAGLPRSCLTAATHFVPRMLALSARCVGGATLVANLVRCSPRAPSRGRQPWHGEYLHGLSHQVYGGQLGPSADGVPFAELATRLFDAHGVVLLAVFRDAQMQVNPPQLALRPRDVVWCLAESEQAAAAALAAETAADGADWRVTYEDLRREAHLDEEEERWAMARGPGGELTARIRHFSCRQLFFSVSSGICQSPPHGALSRPNQLDRLSSPAGAGAAAAGPPPEGLVPRLHLPPRRPPAGPQRLLVRPRP